eukprot:1159145-Pelagomonas_calceolata.AAC.35
MHTALQLCQLLGTDLPTKNTLTSGRMRAAQPERQRGLLQQDCYLPIHTALQLCQLLGGQGGAAHRTQLSQHTQQHKDVAGGAHLWGEGYRKKQESAPC